MKTLVGVIALGLVGCGSNVCDGVKGTCVDVRVTAGTSTLGSVEQLRIDASGAVSGGPVTTPTTPSKKSLPLDVPVSFAAGKAGSESVHVVALAGGNVVGDGSASFVLADGKHQTVEVALAGTMTNGNDLAMQAPGDGGGMPDFAGAPPGDMTKPTVSFGKKGPFTTDSNPIAIKLGDFRGMGAIDVAIATTMGGTGGSVNVFFGDGAGNYPVAANYKNNIGISARDLAVTNLFGVAQQDILVTDGKYQVATFLHNGTTFTTGGVSVSALCQGTGALTVGDFDMDGKPDAVVTCGACGGTSCVLFLKGKGDGSLITPVAANQFNVPSNPTALGNGAFQSAGKPHLLLSQANNLGVMADNGAGVFATPPVTYPAGSEPIAFAVGLFDGDTKLDVAVADHGGSVNVLLGNGDGTFKTAVPFSAGSMPSGIVTADFDGDHILDLAVVNSGSNNVSILIGDGTGNFSAPHNFPVGGAPSGIDSADLNADNRPDLVVTNQADASFTVLLNTTM